MLSLSKTDDILFRRVSPPGGYSFRAINSFNQDKYGYIWMGGFDGIIRYNSKEIVRFTYHPDSEDGLPSNTITSIAIDKKSNIWVSTDRGLCLFDHKRQQFTKMDYTYEDGSEASSNLFSIQVDRQGRLWIVDENFFGYLNEKDNRLIRVGQGVADSPRLIYNDEVNRLWLGTVDGSIFLLDTDSNKLNKIVEGPGSLARTICTSSTNLWVGFQKHGARMYDLDGNLKRHYSYSIDPEIDIESASIRKIWRDTQGQIWIGSYLGLFRGIGSELTYFNHVQFDNLPHNSIFDIFEDREGGIWIGTWSGGVAYIHHSDNKFTNYRQSREPGAISDNMISSFAQTPDGNLYIGTELFGLNRYRSSSSDFEQIDIQQTAGVVDIKDMEVDSRGGLWIASAFNGVYYREEGSNNFLHFSAGEEDGYHVSAPEAYSLCKSDSGMWIGTNLGGVNFYSFESKRITFRSTKSPLKQLLNYNCLSLLVDTNKNLWITTLHGLFKFHLPTEILTHFSVNSNMRYKTRSQSFYFADELSDGKIWIGTGGDGVNIYDNRTDSLTFFDANGLLKGKDVYGVVEGLESDIWITSNDGLILHKRDEESSRRFVMADGIQGNLFNPNAIFRDKDDNLYFGGTNGFSKLEPQPIKTNRREPNVLLSSIKVNNREVIPIQTSLREYEKVVLNPKETSLNFYFSADNYLLPQKNEYAYRLKGYVNEWVDGNSSGSANFVNVPPGSYTFEVKAANNDGIWSSSPITVEVDVQQFWYKHTAMILLYLLLLLMTVALIIRFYRERLKYKKELLIEKIEHRQEEQLNEMKLRFFTNISHEFRTPLTLINGPIKQLIDANNLTTNQYKQLDVVQRNTNRLLQLINQVMDLRKAEKGLNRLNISKIELVSFINERVFNFSEEARSKGISFSFKYRTSSCIIEADEEKLDKIIYNLLSNAFKYTSPNGEITVYLNSSKEEGKSEDLFSNRLSFGELDSEESVEVIVLDNGQGIDGEDLPNIFDRFEQGQETEAKVNSSGIGLSLCKNFTLMHRGAIVVQSTISKGTHFSIKLPKKQKVQRIMSQNHELDNSIHSVETPKPEPLATKPKVQDREITVLIVEDNRDLQIYIAELLDSYYSVLIAKNGVEALKILDRESVELVISDVMMPKMDGFEFCQTVKSQIETSHIPVILLTALSSSENTSTGLERGADAYISKPFDEKVLLSQIDNLLLQRKRLQDSYAQKFVTKQPIDIGNLDNYFLTKINSIIEDNITNENFTVDLLAKEMGFSRSQLHRKLKQISKHSASEYITMAKIKKATVLLNSKEYNIDEIAFMVGFNSHSYFSKCFKKIHGKTPKEYLKNI